MKKRNKLALGVFVTFYVIFGVYITLNQEGIIYHPWPQDFESCASFRDAEKVTHNGTRMYVQSGQKGVVVLYHGNAGSACHRDFYAEQFVRAGYGYIIPEYAGFSNDSRSPTHVLLRQDAENVVSYLRGMNTQNVVVMGESVGTGVASYHTSLQAPDKLLLISPFASLADVAQRKFWFYPAFLLVDDALDNIQLLAHYDGPVTIMHGDQDMIISQKSSLKLYDSLVSEQKEFISIEGYGHNNLFNSERPFEVIQNFLEDVK